MFHEQSLRFNWEFLLELIFNIFLELLHPAGACVIGDKVLFFKLFTKFYEVKLRLLTGHFESRIKNGVSYEFGIPLAFTCAVNIFNSPKYAYCGSKIG